MDILNQLKELDEEKIDEFIKKQIYILTEQSYKRNPNINVIGCNVDINPELDLDAIVNNSVFVENHNFYIGYIPYTEAGTYKIEYTITYQGQSYKKTRTVIYQ